MDDRGQLRVTAWCMLAMAFATSLGFLAQQRRIDTLARQVEVLERDSVHHGARLDAQTTEAFRQIEEAGKPAGGDAARLPGWVDALPVQPDHGCQRRTRDLHRGSADGLRLIKP
jgi:type II secretory pathway component PulJ